METNARVVAKAICWQTLGLAVMTVIGYAFTGSASAGGALAIASAMIGLLSYIAHEKLWARVRWGRMMGGAPEQGPAGARAESAHHR